MTTADFKASRAIHAAPDGLPATLAPSWPAAVTALTDLELSSVALRFGLGRGKSQSFTAIGGGPPCAASIRWTSRRARAGNPRR